MWVWSGLLQMQAISQQPEEDHLTALKAEARSQNPLPLTLLTIHQLDCTYYGEINKSYQKEGFGILFTLPFEAYIGFWRNNRPEGLGLVLFPTGECIYGEFNRSALAGAGVVDDGKFLRVGVFEGLDLVGVGFEYTFPTCKWRMLKYVKGVPVEQLKEEMLSLAEGLPDMISAQHSLHELLSNYLQARFFLPDTKPRKGKTTEDKYQGLNQVLLSKKEDLLALGLRDQGGLHGLALIYNRKERIILQAGYYVGGTLEGYCLEHIEGSGRQIGPFYGGVRQGAFIRYTSRGAQAVDYSEGVEVGESPVLEEQIVKRQKAYNFEQKDFLSAKNNLDFAHLYQLFTPPETRHRQSSRSKERTYEQVVVTDPKGNKGPPRRSIAGGVLKDRTSHTFLQQGERQGERSCVDMIRQKMRGYDVVRGEKNARLSSEEKRRRILDSNLHFPDEAEESIAQEENPFDSALIGNNLLHESPKRRH